MHMGLLGLSFAFIGVAIAAVAFAAATRSNSSTTSGQPELPVAKEISDQSPSSLARTEGFHVTDQVLIDTFLQQLEDHVQLEHEAAESFVVVPTRAKLHSKTKSSFLN